MLEAWHKTQTASLAKDSKNTKLPTPSAEVLEAAVSLVKQAYAECSDHGLLSRALLAAPLYRVRAYCHLTPATPVAPMLAKPTKSVNEVLKRLSGQRLTVDAQGGWSGVRHSLSLSYAEEGHRDMNEHKASSRVHSCHCS